jgi:hypothetical protein
MIDPATVLSSLSNVTNVLNTIGTLLKGSRGTQRSLLLELESNIRLAQIGKKGMVSAEKLVQRLETRAIHKAMESGFNFRSLKSGKVKKSVAGESLQLQRYVGFSTEKLFTNIYLKIRELQNIVALDPGSDHFRVNVRLKNVFRLMLLLVRHIKS